MTQRKGEREREREIGQALSNCGFEVVGCYSYGNGRKGSVCVWQCWTPDWIRIRMRCCSTVSAEGIF